VSPGTSSWAASTISIRVTLLAEMAERAVTGSVDFPEILLPLRRTLPDAWPSPRLAVSSPRIEKPGTWFSMSRAVLGAKRAKSAGV
jgi:hypothetical protein